MTPVELAIIERALGECSCTSEEAEQAAEALGKLRQRDWAVRVLDASGIAWITAPHYPDIVGKRCSCMPLTGENGRAFLGDTGESARLAAALAVFPTLPADARAELGECP